MTLHEDPARTRLRLVPPSCAPAGSPADPSRARAERLLLERLGAALLQEWRALPMPLQRAIYARAALDEASVDSAPLRRRLACLLHEQAGRGDAGAPARPAP